MKKDICTPLFTAELFIIGKIRKQPKYPLTDDWIKQMWNLYVMKYYSVIKKKRIK